ncbi:MAG: diadenylate cyclase CdaA [Acidobacteriota bacterium]
MERWLELVRFEQLRDPTAWLDIALLWFAIYTLLTLIRRTRAEQMIWGLAGVVVMFFLTDPSSLIPMRAVHWVLGQLLLYGPFALIVIFSGPVRQALAHFGRVPILRWRTQDTNEPLIEEVALAAAAMGTRRIGALIVFERAQGLRTYIETGIGLDAHVTYDLLTNVFTPKTPLHDGAVIISEGRIKAACCYLPLSVDPYISREYGTRHRAAIGISEETDAIAVVVSEERGIVSLAIDGKLTQDLDSRGLKQLLLDQMMPERTVSPLWRWATKRASRTTESAS